MTSGPLARTHLDAGAWRALGTIQAGPVALWADHARVYALLRETRTGDARLVSVDAGDFTPLSGALPAALGFERMIYDLWGHGEAGPAWFDHGNWTVTQPLSPRPGPPPAEPTTAAFVGEDEDHATRWLIGPIAGDVTGPRHWRLRLSGTLVAGVQRAVGHAHRGALALMRGQSPRAAARFATRLSARAAVGHAVAFARAAEAASSVIATPRARALRALVLEIERVGLHLSHIGMIATVLEAHAVRDAAALARETWLRVAEACFGHRLMMDVVTPGGVARDIHPDGVNALRPALTELRALSPYWTRMIASRRYGARLRGLGALTLDQAARMALGGPAGRATGLHWDARADDPDPYDQPWRIVTADRGDALDRVMVRVREIEVSARLIERLSAAPPDGALAVPLEPVDGEGIGCAEAADGDVWHWLRLEGGRIAANFARDPDPALASALETALIGADADNVSLLLRELGGGAAGGDL